MCGNRVAEQAENLRKVSPVARDHDVVGAKRGLCHLHRDSILVTRRGEASLEPLLRAQEPVRSGQIRMRRRQVRATDGQYALDVLP